jgi:Protein of unknown function (DUF3102)
MSDIVEAPAPTLQDLLDQHAEELAEHAEAIRAYGKRTVQSVLAIGRHLAEVKQLLGHGNWLSWLEQEFNWSEDTAERLIAVYKLQRQIPHVAELSLPFSGLYLLAAPSTPPEAIEVVVAKAEVGEQITVAEIRETVRKAKSPESVRKPERSSNIPAEKHELEAAKAGAKKSAKAVTPGTARCLISRRGCSIFCAGSPSTARTASPRPPSRRMISPSSASSSPASRNCSRRMARNERRGHYHY